MHNGYLDGLKPLWSKKIWSLFWHQDRRWCAFRSLGTRKCFCCSWLVSWPNYFRYLDMLFNPNLPPHSRSIHPILLHCGICQIPFRFGTHGLLCLGCNECRQYFRSDSAGLSIRQLGSLQPPHPICVHNWSLMCGILAIRQIARCFNVILCLLRILFGWFRICRHSVRGADIGYFTDWYQDRHAV